MYTTPRELIDALYDKISNASGVLGITHVYYGNDDLFPEYPAILVSGGPAGREIYATHLFRLSLRGFIWVYHANLTEDHKTRTQEDLKLVEAVIALLHSDMTLGGNVINGYVESEEPGTITRAGEVVQLVVGSRISYVAESREVF